MNRWPIRPLGELSEIVMGQAPPGNECNFDGKGIPFVKAGEFGERRPIIREWTTRSLKIAKASDVLVCVVGATCGKLNLGADCAIGRSVAAIRPNSSLLNQGFLYAFLQGWTLRLRTGSQGSAQGVITRYMLESIPMPAPPLAEQERLVKLLDEADELRKLRTKADHRTAELIPGIFHEMFGDPASNSKNWRREALSKTLKTLYRYPTFYGTSYVEDGVPVARIGNILPSNMLDSNLSRYVRVPYEFSAKFPKTVLKSGDLVMAVRGDTTGKIGFVPLNLEGANISPNLIRISPDTSRVTNEYLLWLFLLVPTLVKSKVTDTAKKSITAENIGKIKIPIPPLSLQKKFAEQVAGTRELEADQAASRRRMDALFQSLLHSAFSGEI